MKKKQVWVRRLWLAATSAMLMFGSFGTVSAAPAKAQTSQTTQQKKTLKPVGFYTNKQGKTFYIHTPGKRARGKKLINGKYYVFGQDSFLLKNQWVNRGGYMSRAGKDGALKIGFWKAPNGQKYYFDAKGNMKYGWQKIKGRYFYFGHKTGRLYRGRVQDGITLAANGKAYVTAQNKKYLDIYVRCRQIAESITTPGMSKKEKLRAAINYVISKPYRLLHDPFQGGSGWEVLYANDTLNGGGSCFADGCAAAFMAHAVGIKETYACSNAVHGWAVINGKVYDPLFEEAYHSLYYYGGFKENENAYIATYKVRIGTIK